MYIINIHINSRYMWNTALGHFVITQYLIRLNYFIKQVVFIQTLKSKSACVETFRRDLLFRGDMQSTTHLVRNADCFSCLIGPPHHQIGESCDPQHAARESESEPFTLVLQEKINISPGGRVFLLLRFLARLSFMYLTFVYHTLNFTLTIGQEC